MDSFCISSSILGTEKNIVVSSDGFFSTTCAPKDAWFLNGVLDPTKPLCLDTLFKLKGVTIDLTPHEKWLKSYKSVSSGSLHSPPWSMLMPSSQYKHFVKNLVKSVAESMDGLPKDYYNNVWGPSGKFLASLKAARVDPVAYRAAVDASLRDSGSLETFRPGPGGYLPPVVYDRFATRTGRLTVQSGPNILTLKKEYRKLLRSTFQSGVICSLDFNALEARIILAEAGAVFKDDIYSAISNKLFSGAVSRDTIKIAVISELYGSSKHALGNRLGFTGKKLDEFVTAIQSFFKTAELRKRLKNDFMKTGKVKNYHGRYLDLDDPQDHLFVNTYTQSTGVDVSLLGFKKVVDSLGTDGVRPIFVLHDALILDVREDRIKDVKSVSFVKVDGYDIEFPLKFEEVSGVQSSNDDVE